MVISLIIVAILPVVVLSVVVYRQDRFSREPVRLLAKCFFFGALSILPAAFLEAFLERFEPDIPIVNGIYTGFVVAGCCEELCKLLMLALAVWRSSEFDEYFDGIVYACFVSLGFACIENLGYVFSQGDFYSAVHTGTVRAVLSVPAHFLFGVMMGYYFALAKFDIRNRDKHLFRAFLVPMLMHGTFDALLMIPEGMGEAGAVVDGPLFMLLVFFDIKMWRWGVRRILRLQELSQRQGFDRSNPFDGFTWDV